jgi:Family of unknown function (DUF5681)
MQYRLVKEMRMADGGISNPPGRGPGRRFEKGRSGNPAGRRRGSRNKATLAAAALLASECEALTLQSDRDGARGRPVEKTRKDGSCLNLLQILTAGVYDDGYSEDDCDEDDYEETDDYEKVDDCDS